MEIAKRQRNKKRSSGYSELMIMTMKGFSDDMGFCSGKKPKCMSSVGCSTQPEIDEMTLDYWVSIVKRNLIKLSGI